MLQIRPATIEDAAEIARLSGQLGYSSSLEQIIARLRALLTSPSDILLVAPAGPDRLAGWVHAFESRRVESDARIEIGGLVVDEACRRRGIGGELVRRIEHWAAQRGIGRSRARCQAWRTDSHTFYQRLGYSQTKTQFVFDKNPFPNSLSTRKPK